MSRKINSLSVVFSFRNEEEVLKELVARTRGALAAEIAVGQLNTYELVFVNDASTDRSLEILLEEAKRAKDIKIINMSRPFGVSPCVMAGLELASGDWVVYLDADLQDPPEVIRELLKAVRDDDKVDVVHTVRRSRKGEPKEKLLITRLGYSILNKVTSIHLPMESGDFKLLSRRAVHHLVQLREKKPFMRGLVCWIGFKQVFVPYDRDARFAGQTKFSVFSFSVFNNFIESALISFSAAPLKLAILLGFLAIIFDFALLTHALIEKIKGSAVPGWTAIMIAVLFIGAIQLFCIGIVGLYINSIFEETKGRPNYIVESTFGFDEERFS